VFVMPDSICQGESIHLIPNDTTLGILHYWYASPNSGIPLHIGKTYQTPRIYQTTTFWIMTSMHGCSSTVRYPITVKVKNAPQMPNMVGFNFACLNERATASIFGRAGDTYLWYSDSTSGTAFHIGTSYTTAPMLRDTAFWIATVSNGCTSLFRSYINMPVKPMPNAPKVDNIYVCLGEKGILKVLNEESNVRYYWYKSRTEIVKNQGDTSYYLTETLTSDSMEYWVEAELYGCRSQRIKVMLYKKTLPPPVIRSLTNTCPGGIITLRAEAIGGGTNHWYKDTNGVELLTSDTLRTPILNAPATYYVRADNGFCKSYFVKVNVTLTAPPPTDSVKITAPFTIGWKQRFAVSANAGNTPVQFFWDFGAGGMPRYVLGYANDTHWVAFNVFGLRTIEVQTVVGNCTTITTKSIYVNPNTSIDGKLEGNNVLIYPNPASETLTIQWDNLQKTPVTISLYDGLGKLIYKNVEATNLHRLDVSKLSKGVYSLSLLIDGQRIVKNVVVE